ncbi:hypothetical protein [Desulfogranum japonicum]|uniref:hypothetical protein n=1 Tax=Desulfogranum japonicum TaxID=231447 RepID=UPI00040AE095|nr:hypothetical protein [Desulfogranum japonicum]
MRAKETFKKKIKTKLRGIQGKLLELQTKAKQTKAPLRTKYIKHLKSIERQAEDTTF